MGQRLEACFADLLPEPCYQLHPFSPYLYEAFLPGFAGLCALPSRVAVSGVYNILIKSSYTYTVHSNGEKRVCHAFSSSSLFER